MPEITFILGGVRSGKSNFAEAMAVQTGKKLIYLATAANMEGDGEMASRITSHKARRGENWQVIEEQVDIAGVISSACHPALVAGSGATISTSAFVSRPRNKCGVTESVILIDCLTLWLSNLLHYGLDIAEQTDKLIAALKTTNADVILVSNEVGQGIIPDNALARKFVDEAGKLHQQIAAIADEVFFVTAGIPTKIKG